jgi:hypothetical protein
MSPAGLGPENDCAGEIQQQLNDRPAFLSERMLHKEYDRKCSVEKRKLLIVGLKWLVAEMN